MNSYVRPAGTKTAMARFRSTVTRRLVEGMTSRPFSFGSRTGQGSILESVALGALGVGTLYLGGW